MKRQSTEPTHLKPENLRGTTDRLIDTLESISDGFVSLDKNWCYTYVNKRAAEMFNRNAEDLIGKHIWTEFPEGIGQRFYDNYQKAMEQQKPITMEEYYPPWNRWFENRIYPTKEGLSIFFQEITDRRRAEELVNGQKRLLEMIASGKPLEETLTELVLFVEAQFSGMICTILLMDEDGIRLRHGAAPNLPAGLIAAIDGSSIGPKAGSCGTAAFRGENVFVEDIAADTLWEDYRNVFLLRGLRSCWSSPIFDEDRRVLGTFAIYSKQPALPDSSHLRLIDMATHIAAISITRSRSEELLRRNEQQLGLIYDTVSDVIFLLELQPDKRFRFVSVNHAFLIATGLKQEQVIGKYVEKVIPPSAHEVVFDNYWKAIRERRTVQWEEATTYPTGRKTAIVTISPVFDEDQRCTHLVGAVHDITEFREAEEALRKGEEERAKLQEQVYQAQKLELIGRLAAGVAHQLNTPLAVIMMRLQMLKDDLSSIKQHASFEQVDGILRSAKKMTGIVQDLLNFSRVSNLEKENVQIEEVLNQVLSFVDIRAKKQKVDLRKNFSHAIPVIDADKNRLEQAFLNIIINALDAMPGGGVLTITTGSGKLSNTDYATIEFRDTGSGMTQEQTTRIFDPFFTTKPAGEGTGLGLSVTYEIIRSHGGEIRVRSQKDEGTVFEVLLPLGV
jgi:PAS domain S-box-containing protein